MSGGVFDMMCVVGVKKNGSKISLQHGEKSFPHRHIQAEAVWKFCGAGQRGEARKNHNEFMFQSFLPPLQFCNPSGRTRRGVTAGSHTRTHTDSTYVLLA